MSSWSRRPNSLHIADPRCGRQGIYLICSSRNIRHSAPKVRSSAPLSAGAAIAAGAKEAKPPQDYGFMQLRSFLDLDGHHWEILYMDPAHVQSKA
jgi:predicted lactoylglutathione lyase